MKKLNVKVFPKKQNEQVLNFSQIQALCISPANLHCLQRHDKLLETVLLMAFFGLRVSEAINFSWQTIPVEDKSAFLVNGKGNKQRLVFNLLNHSYISKKSKSDLTKDHWKTISRIAVWNYLKKKSPQLNLMWPRFRLLLHSTTAWSFPIPHYWKISQKRCPFPLNQLATQRIFTINYD